MRTACQATTVLLLFSFAAASTRGVAEERSVSPDCKTPEALFAAYKKATNDREWKTLFSLASVEYQNSQLMDYAIGAAFSEEDPMHPEELRTYRAILAKHGVDWKQVRQLVPDEQISDDNDAFVVPLQRIIDRTKSKADLFSEVNDFFASTSDPPSVTVLQMKNLVQKGSTAQCESAERRVVTETTIDAATNVTRKIRREVPATSRLFFRQINGQWRLDVGQSHNDKK